MQVAYRFVSVLNEQGFIEGRYVPVVGGKTVIKDAEVSAPPPVEESSESTESTNGDASAPAGPSYSISAPTTKNPDSPPSKPASTK
jgi:hypothetical protein